MCEHSLNSCPRGMFGSSCEKKCGCSNNMACNTDGHSCICESGLIGTKCENSCKLGYFGRNCVQKCPQCYHSNQTCNTQDGTCVCQPGYIGSFCEKVTMSIVLGCLTLTLFLWFRLVQPIDME